MSDREEVLRIHALLQNGKHPSQQRLESFNSISFADVALDWDAMGAIKAHVTVVVDEGVLRIPDVWIHRDQAGKVGVSFPGVSFRIATYEGYTLSEEAKTVCDNLADELLPKARPMGALGVNEMRVPQSALRSARSRARRHHFEWRRES